MLVDLVLNQIIHRVAVLLHDREGFQNSHKRNDLILTLKELGRFYLPLVFHVACDSQLIICPGVHRWQPSGPPQRRLDYDLLPKAEGVSLRTITGAPNLHAPACTAYSFCTVMLREVSLATSTFVVLILCYAPTFVANTS